jgi:uncharacterized protein DUF2516
VFGPDLLIVLAVLFFTVGLPLWAIVDAASRPAVAFYAAGSNKAAWVAVLVVATLLGIGVLLGGFYLLSTRRKVRQHTQALSFR